MLLDFLDDGLPGLALVRGQLDRVATEWLSNARATAV